MSSIYYIKKRFVDLTHNQYIPPREGIDDPLCFTACENGCTVTLTAAGENPPSVSLEYSTDNQTWNTYNVGTTITMSNYGDKVYFKGINTTFGKSSGSLASGDCNRFVLTGLQRALGNIMSLVDPTCQSTTIPGTYCFRLLFFGNKTLLSPPLMPATTLKTGCYKETYYGCTGMASPPALPATSVSNSAYYSMLHGSGIKTAPYLPGTSLEGDAYLNMFRECLYLVHAHDFPSGNYTFTGNQQCYNMFYGCSSLRRGPSSIPFQTLPTSCCYYMFSGCGELENLPNILSTSVGASACRQMFNECVNAQGTPDILFTEMGGNQCMYAMFRMCQSMSGVKVHFTDWENGYTDTTTNWLSNAASSGTFICPAALNTTTRSVSRVPEGWTVETFTE